MKILVFSWRDPEHPLAGGAEQVMHEHMKGWVNAGHNVTLFSSRFNNSNEKEEVDGIKIIRRGYEYLGVQICAFLFYIQKGKEYDIVVDQFHGIPFFTPLFVKKPKLAVIQETAREVWFMNPLPVPFNFIVGLLGFLIEPFIFVLYKNTPFMTGSESAKEDVAKFGIPKKNITIVPHGVIIKKPKEANKEKIKTVVFLGVLSKDKGIDDALKCFALLNSLAEFNFWVIGRAENTTFKTHIEEMVKRLKIEKKVIFWGFVSQEEKFELLSRAHILVNPSKREGWGLVNIEANAVGLPVVAYSSRGLVDSVRDGVSGILCEHNTPQDMAKNVARILFDKNLYGDLQKGAKCWSNNFSWNVSVAKSLELINEVGRHD